jgi:hypothetical protein
MTAAKHMLSTLHKLYMANLVFMHGRQPDPTFAQLTGHHRDMENEPPTTVVWTSL